MVEVTTLEGMIPGIPFLGNRNGYKRLNGNALVLLGRRSFLARQARNVGHVVAKAGRATGHAVAQAGRVTRRVAKRIVRGVASKILLHGDGLLGIESAAMSRTSAKALLMPSATAAVASGLPIAAPLVPVLVNEVVDEVYDAIKKKVSKGASPESAAADVKTALQADDDRVLSSGVSMPVMLGIGAGLVALALVLKKR